MIVMWAILIIALAFVPVVFWLLICSSSPLAPIDREIEMLKRRGYVEVRWEMSKLFIRTFKRSGNVLYVMDGNPKKFTQITFAEGGDVIEVKQYETTSSTYPDTGAFAASRDDGIIR